MNTAYDNPERPHTPSYVGNYTSYHEPGPPPSYIYKEDKPSRSPLPSSSSTVGFLPPEKKKKHGGRCGSCLVLALLVLFIAVSIVMIALYFARESQGDKGTDNGKDGGTSPGTKQTPAPPTHCRTIPKPVAFTTLPKPVQDELSSMKSFIEDQMKSGGPSAVTANIVYMDKVIWRGEFGVMDNSKTPKQKPTTKTIFPIASVTKVLTVLMLYKLQNDRFVSSLDDPVTNYQSNFFVKNPFGDDPITLRELASHRSGLQREAPCYPATKTNLCPYSNTQMIERLRNLTLLREPGKEPYYSNLGFALLGQVLGERFGNAAGYEGWIKDNILSTFEMEDTYFDLDNSIRQRIPIGYTSKTEFSNVKEWGWLNPTGGAFSTVADFAKLEMALFKLDTNKYLSKALAEALFAPEYILRNGKDVIGTPWEMVISDDLLIRKKQGDAYGYNALIVLLPEMKLALNIFCTNCGNLRTAVGAKFSNTFLPAFKEELLEARKKEIRPPPDTKPYVGIYSVEGLEPLKFLEAKMKDDELILSINGVADAFILNYTKPLTFKIVVPSVFPCSSIFSLGVDNDAVVFDSPSKEDGLCDRFTMWSAAPSGRTYFNRVRDSNSA
ncbi:putative beta-lactamase-like 1 isoform X2 [Oculina patagonica]